MPLVSNWKMFAILLGSSLISVLCVLPYVLTLQGDLLRQTGQPLALILGVQLAQALVLFSIAIIVGLKLTQKPQFQLPLLQALVEKGDYRKVLKRILGQSVLLGVATAGAIYGMDSLFTLLGAGITTHQTAAPLWQKLLASFYGGITEEILMRLFVMTLFIWLGMKLFKQPKPNQVTIIVAICLASIIFGLGHLPITATLTAITPLIVARAVVLNGVGGVVFGWLFWKHGLESAMLAHFIADIFLLSLLPLVIN